MHAKTALVVAHPKYTDHLDMLACTVRPSTAMRCPMQARQTSKHALTRTEDHTQTHRTQNTARLKKRTRWVEERSSSRLQDKSEPDDKCTRDRRISKHFSQMLLSLRILRICVDYANTLTIMTTAQPTSTRCPLQRRQKSNHVLTFTGTDEHPDLNTLDSSCQRFAQPNAVTISS